MLLDNADLGANQKAMVLATTNREVHFELIHSALCQLFSLA